MLSNCWHEKGEIAMPDHPLDLLTGCVELLGGAIVIASLLMWVVM